MTAVAVESTAVWDALSTVRDPELDEPITALGFVTSSDTDAGTARIRLRLPTYFCAPNFAYMMVADAYDAVAGVDGVDRVDVSLDDHFASEQINAGVAAKAGFTDAFPGESHDELEELRVVFLRKSHTASTERVSKTMMRDGMSLEQLCDARLADVPPSEDLDRLLRRRVDLGLAHGPDAFLLVDDDGVRVRPEKADVHLRYARSVRVSAEWNSGHCRSMLVTRYGDDVRAAQTDSVNAG